jgi:hypothetical protein
MLSDVIQPYLTLSDIIAGFSYLGTGFSPGSQPSLAPLLVAFDGWVSLVFLST